jgi:hypothetical protein
VSRGYEILWIQNIGIALDEINWNHGIHVMDDNSIMNIESIYAKILSEISSDDFVSSKTPFSTFVELLIEMTFETKRRFSDCAFMAKVFKSIFKRIKPN